MPTALSLKRTVIVLALVMLAATLSAAALSPGAPLFAG